MWSCICRESEQLGLTVLRTWAFADGPQWNSIQPNLGQLDERVLSEVCGASAYADLQCIPTYTVGSGSYA